MSNDLPDWTVAQQTGVQIKVGGVIGLASLGTNNALAITPTLGLIYGVEVSAALEGATPGAASAMAILKLTDGTTTIVLTEIVVIEATVSSFALVFPTPWAPSGLNRANTWTVTVFNDSILGTAALDVGVTLLYG